MKPVFVSGCYRSGTTLLEKLLHHHPSLCIASQPFGDFYLNSKAKFLEEKRIKRRYPLDHLFLEEEYSPADFMSYLSKLQVCSTDLDKMREMMVDNKLGLWTPEIIDHLDKVKNGSFYEVYLQLIKVIAEIFPKPNILFAGGKEVYCEEFIPFLLSRGCKVIHIVRDPRAMIASLNFRVRDNLTGDHRPVLYSIRAWRKSVAYGFAFKDNEDFYMLNYEDLVDSTLSELNSIADFLDVEEFSEKFYSQGIRHQNGDIWMGNSSFADKSGVTKESVNKWSDILPQEVLNFVEACCYPEMSLLGYSPRITLQQVEEAITTYRDPFARIHAKFRENYSHSSEHIAEELKRINYLIDECELDDNKIEKWFIFEEAYKKLKNFGAIE